MGLMELDKTGCRSRIEFCIDAFVEEMAYVPAEARRVRDASELSPQLERLAGTISAPTGWRAWIDGPRGWFVQGRFYEFSEDATDRPTLYLIFRDHDARPAAVGVWCRSAPGYWEPQQTLTCWLE